MEQKKCINCNLVKKITDYYRHPQTSDGFVNSCKECAKKLNRENWRNKKEEKKEYDYYRHRFSIIRIFSSRYDGIKKRCTKHYKNQRYLKVYGSEFISKTEWLEWCYKDNNYKKFINIYNQWVQNNFERKYAPSIDRINSSKTYTVDNIQWLTFSENCKKQ